MSDSLSSLAMRSSLASIPTTQFLVNERAPMVHGQVSTIYDSPASTREHSPSAKSRID